MCNRHPPPQCPGARPPPAEKTLAAEQPQTPSCRTKQRGADRRTNCAVHARTCGETPPWRQLEAATPPTNKCAYCQARTIPNTTGRIQPNGQTGRPRQPARPNPQPRSMQRGSALKSPEQTPPPLPVFQRFRRHHHTPGESKRNIIRFGDASPSARISLFADRQNRRKRR